MPEVPPVTSTTLPENFLPLFIVFLFWLIEVRSFQDAIFEMRHTRAGDRPGRLELYAEVLRIVEQARAATEDNWYAVKRKVRGYASGRAFDTGMPPASQAHRILSA